MVIQISSVIARL